MSDNFKQSYRWTELCKERTGMTPREFEKQYQTKWTPEITLIPTVKLEEMQSQLQAAQSKIKELEQVQESISIENAITISAYTGYLMVDNFGLVHKAIEEKLGRPVFTHEMASKEVQNEIKAAFKQDFIALVPPQPKGE